MNQRRPTLFESRVYEMVSHVPRGKVVTYGELARALGCRSAQAVGQALRRNPFAPQVPCHRVVSAKGGMGGYFGETEGVRLEEKRRLLMEEGVIFTLKGISVESLWFFEKKDK